MSRIGKKIITIPKDVSIVLEKDKIVTKGPHGTLERSFKNFISLEMAETTLQVNRLNETKECRSYHGLMRALIQNMVTGVSEKYQKTLIAEGIGYKFQVDKESLVLNMGYSHPIKFKIPNDLNIQVESPTRISISGIDKERVGFLASEIRDVRPPEPYKGKGIRYENEIILRKAGKSGK
jgi:large subunit ribosomal protein L6|tara:strand:+ start:8587 stop:9123 length:537 start_codon:yes stop_codon:yes gene_type:complete